MYRCNFDVRTIKAGITSEHQVHEMLSIVGLYDLDCICPLNVHLYQEINVSLLLNAGLKIMLIYFTDKPINLSTSAYHCHTIYLSCIKESSEKL